jgi:membrane-associated phospholipid phosphatase
MMRALLLLLLLAASGARAEAVAPRPFFSSTLHAIGDAGLSPLRVQADELGYLAFAAGASAMVLASDKPLYQSLAKGDARRDWLDASMPTVSFLGEGYMEALYALGLYAVGDERLRRTSGQALQGLAVVGVYATVLKYAAWSNRPSQDDKEHRFFAYDQPSTGMPSGHSFSAFCVAEIYGAEYGRWLTYPLAGLVAYSRIYNQAHWPSDVLVGSLLGVATGVGVRHWAEQKGTPLFQLGMRPADGAPQLALSLEF